MTDTTGEENQMPLTVSETIAKVLVSDFSLQVTREDAAFLCGIHAHLEITRQPSLEEDELMLIYAAVADAAVDGGLSYHQRAGSAITRLRKQGLLERTDARGMASFGNYTLSALAVKLRDEIFERESLNRRSLRVMLKRVIADLSIIKNDAQQGGDQSHWDERIVDPLRYLVAEVIRSIARRQKGLEADQMDVQKKIQIILKSDNWKESVRLCDSLLQTTGNTLEELHRILLEEMGAVQNLLSEIGDEAERRNQREASNMVIRLQEQVDAIATWSMSFQATWSEYYSRAHEFIRTAIRVDPNRRLAQRLRASIKGYARQPWHIVTPDAEQFRYLRDEEALPVPKALTRVTVKPHKEAVDTTRQSEQVKDDMVAALEEVLRRTGRVVLSEFLRPRLAPLTDDEVFVLVGALQNWLMRHAYLAPKRENGWICLRGNLEIQDVTALAVPEDQPGRLEIFQELFK